MVVARARVLDNKPPRRDGSIKDVLAPCSLFSQALSALEETSRGVEKCFVFEKTDKEKKIMLRFVSFKL